MRNVISQFANGKVSHLKSFTIPGLLTGPDEWVTAATIIYKSLQHGHYIDLTGIGFDGEMNGYKTKHWRYNAQLYLMSKLLNKLSPEECEKLNRSNYKTFVAGVKEYYPKKYEAVFGKDLADIHLQEESSEIVIKAPENPLPLEKFTNERRSLSTSSINPLSFSDEEHWIT